MHRVYKGERRECGVGWCEVIIKRVEKTRISAGISHFAISVYVWFCQLGSIDYRASR